MSESPRAAEVQEPATSNSTAEAQQSPDENELQDMNAGHLELGDQFEVKEQDRWLPIANVARIMKGALPDNAKIAKEAKECMQECVSEFISFITSEASEKCQQEKRKTVNGEDILFAMTSLGFENYAEALKIYLARYRETLVARGEQPRQSGAGGGANTVSTSPPYDAGGHGVLGGAMEPQEATSDFPYGGVGHGGSGDY
ncbi:hypothetical protein AAFC00_001783 [Neodothiora populina]|uniref:Transcription factor CBF/NF-Y/archaeal histone domain-containing protein n=1 Tax=Neodothiora populina TaxID=2781224 RepID=A0ABR3PR74_9PEZI